MGIKEYGNYSFLILYAHKMRKLLSFRIIQAPHEAESEKKKKVSE